MKKSKILAVYAAACLLCAGAVSCGGSGSSSSSPSSKTDQPGYEQNEDDTTAASSEEEAQPEEDTTSAAADETTSAPEETTEPAEDYWNSYEDNSLFDVVEREILVPDPEEPERYCVVDKIVAKKTGKFDMMCCIKELAEGEHANGKEFSEDSVYLTAGKTNYFRYDFKGEQPETFYMYPQEYDDDYAPDERGDDNAVEMTDWAIVDTKMSGDMRITSLAIKLKQVEANIGKYPQWKLLLYKEGKVVGYEEGSVGVSAKNLNGAGSEDVFEYDVYYTDFDDIEFIFEPCNPL